MTDAPKKRFRFVKTKTALAIGAFMTVGLSAMAAILIAAGVTGSLTTVAKPTISYYSPSGQEPRQLSTDGSGIVCAPTIKDSKLDVVITNAMAGATCVIDANIRTSANGLVIQDLHMSGLDVAFTSEGNNPNPAVCGKALDKDLVTDIVLKVSVPQDAGLGTKPVAGELSAVPAAQYDPALCTAGGTP